jgi:hypothetical protein
VQWGGINLVSTELTEEEVAEQKRERELETLDRKMEIYKMLTSLAINMFVIVILVLGTLLTTGDFSSRFMGLLEVVIGAIFGVTATQIAKEDG